MANKKKYVAIFVPAKVRKAIKLQATENDRTMIEDLAIKYDAH